MECELPGRQESVSERLGSGKWQAMNVDSILLNNLVFQVCRGAGRRFPSVRGATRFGFSAPIAGFALDLRPSSNTFTR
jgi:hypothetical protein